MISNNAFDFMNVCVTFHKNVGSVLVKILKVETKSLEILSPLKFAQGTISIDNKYQTSNSFYRQKISGLKNCRPNFKSVEILVTRL